MSASRLTAGLIALLILAAPAHGQQASVGDTARYIAGMPVPENSPLAPLTKSAGWQSHASAMNKAFAVIDKTQLSAIREWSAEHVKNQHETAFYMFSGPDFLFVNAFFPNASTYVLVALEPTGSIPDVMKTREQGLSHVQFSMRTLLALTFFITKDMRETMGESALRGTIPILYVFAARSGKELKDASLVYIDADGKIQPENPKAKSGARGVKITMTGANGKEQTLYYFVSDLSNDGVRTSGLTKFMETLAPGDSFHKSASYLMHKPNFSRIAQFLAEKSAIIVQDDSGIPLRYLDEKKWELHPFGRYYDPLGIFPEGYQPKIRELFANSSPGKLPFGLGYRWRPGESNLLLAVNRDFVPKPADKPAEAPTAKPEEKPAEKPAEKPEETK